MTKILVSAAAALALMVTSSVGAAQAAPAPPPPSPAPPFPPASVYNQPGSAAPAATWGGGAEAAVDRSAGRTPAQDDPSLPPAERVARHPYMALIGARAMFVPDDGFDALGTLPAHSRQ